MVAPQFRVEPSDQREVDQRRLTTAARFEVERVRQARAAQTALILRRGLTEAEMEHVKLCNGTVPGLLGALWTEFSNLPLAAQLRALGEPTFRGMSWQSLLQCNPYAMLAQWEPIKLRSYQ